MSIITLLRFEISMDGSWQVAATESEVRIDRPQAMDGNDVPYVPTTSLAGSLRHHLAAQDMDRQLMGSRPEDPDETSAPSALRLLGTTLVDADGPILLRQTAVDRDRGSALNQSLRSSRVMVGGTVVLYGQMDRVVTDDEMAALAGWIPALGGGRSSGRGVARLTSFRSGTLDLASPLGLTGWLGGGGPDRHDDRCTVEQVREPIEETSFLNAHLRIIDGLLVPDVPPERTDRSADVAPMRRAGQYVIPGSSLKGVLRSRCELILRSLGVEVCERGCPPDAEGCAICVVFGHVGQAAAVQILDAPVVGATQVRRHHVAIDRVAGGAGDGLLFHEDVLVAGAFDIVIRTRPDADPPAHALSLLSLALVDVVDGLVGIGSRTSRGYGTVSLVEPTDRDVLAGVDRGPLIALVGGAR